MNISIKPHRKKRLFCIASGIFLVFGFFFPSRVSAYGLGDAGSLTKEGLVIGLAILGVILLVFLGLLLMSKVNKLTDVEQESLNLKSQLPTSADIMNLSESEINTLIQKRRRKTDIES